MLWITVLASAEKPSEIEQAREKGYATALVVEEFLSEKAFKIGGSKAMVVPCPAETRRTTCADCRLCLDRDLLDMNVAIAFKLHGQHEAAGRRALIRHNFARQEERATEDDPRTTVRAGGLSALVGRMR